MNSFPIGSIPSSGFTVLCSTRNHRLDDEKPTTDALIAQAIELAKLGYARASAAIGRCGLERVLIDLCIEAGCFYHPVTGVKVNLGSQSPRVWLMLLVVAGRMEPNERRRIERIAKMCHRAAHARRGGVNMTHAYAIIDCVQDLRAKLAKWQGQAMVAAAAEANAAIINETEQTATQ